MKNYYKILGIERDVHIIDIRKAYRKKALELHPDKNTSPNASIDFIEVNEAYSVLKHATSKVRYDKLYDHIFGDKKTNETKYNQRKASRTEFVNNRAERGKAKAQTKSNMKSGQFEKQANRSGIFDGLSMVIEFIGNLLVAFL